MMFHDLSGCFILSWTAWSGKSARSTLEPCRNGAGIRVPKMTPFQLDLLAIDTDGILAGWNQKGMRFTAFLRVFGEPFQ